ncbi:MAG TPA: hypothetical protein VFW45_16160, partial [Candidatus Polarisedimenticolia bacterium]|nr:hypothetical protein [Candidatus Polarisedimenticolia bacterium]
MPSRFTAQSGKGAILVALALVATLLVPSMYTWAVKGTSKPGVDLSGQQDERDIDKAALTYFQRLAVPDQERPLDLSPIGTFTPNIPPVGKRKGWVETQIGFFNPKDAKSFDALPADLRPVAAHAAPNGKGIGVGSSTSIIQISEAALKEKGYNAIDARIKELGLAIVETQQDRALTVRGNDKAMMAVMAEPFVEAALPYAPAFKLDPSTGRQQLLDKTRASKMEIDVLMRTWDKKDVDAVLQDLKAKHSDTVSLLEDGLTIRATLDKNELKRVLRNDAVSMVREVPEYTLQANFVLLQDPPVVQVGESEHTFAATPYWDAGVDGGGCGYCSNAFGTACTTDAGCVAPGTCVHASASQCTSSVPAVIVAVLDNGASTDAATLAHSTAVLTEAAISGLIAGNNHRKIRSYQVLGGDVGVLGTTCDNVLSGGQTHGNVVAGIIAGNASALGFTFQKNSNAASFGDVRRINLDGSARGARLHIQDAGPASACPVAELTERGLISGLGGTLTARMNDAYATGTRLHVMPFGIPTWIATGTPTASAGTYTADSSDIDRYLLNNLEYQVFVPVGNKGFVLSNGRDLIPDFFDGEASATSDPASANPGVTRPLQTSPPATAKNGVSAGSSCTDTFTMFGAFNEEENTQNYTAKGPASAASLRTAPIVVGIGNDRTPTGGGPAPYGMYTVKSKDNNQDGTVDAEIDEQARGTSFGAASLAAAAALMQDYFHQGFYPSGDRIQGDRVPVLSGAAVKALLAASANFQEQLIGLNATTSGMDGLDAQVATTRGSVVTISGTPRVLGNNQQGYGRAIVSQVLPLVNWANVGIPPDGAITQDTIEKPGLGLLVWEHGVDPDGAGPDTALGVFTGATIDHHFTVLGNQGEIRACVDWPDPPSNTLVNDLDLELISPTGTIYDGNVYNPANQAVGQWGLGRTIPPDFGDIFNPIECVHLHDDPDNNPATNDNQIVPGVWTLRVKQGAGGAVPGAISQINGPNEDANANNRLDAGEDLDADNQLDKGGQVFAAVVSGPLVATKDGSNPAYFTDYPASIARLDKIRYSCSDDASVFILDGDASADTLVTFVTARVLNAAGVQVDSESNIEFGGSNSMFTSGAIPVRFGTTGTADNGVLEGDTGYTIEVSYADQTANSRTAVARAPMNCDPNFIGGVFGNPGERNKSDLVFGGCDNDQFFDKNEIVTYSVAVVNNDLFDQYTDVTATLRACAVPFVGGTCGTPSTVLTVLDSPKSIGRMPVGQPEAVSFTVQVSATPLAQGPRVFLRVDLSQTSAAKDLSRLTFEFVHAMGADRQSLHYSTDYPNGSGSITRDLNRSLVIEPNDRPGLTLGLLDETINFSTLFFTDPSTGRINNQIQAGDEAYPALG